MNFVQLFLRKTYPPTSPLIQRAPMTERGTDFVQIEELTKVLDHSENEAVIVRKDVPIRARLRFEFSADANLSPSIEAITYRDKLCKSYREPMFMLFGNVLRSLESMQHGTDIIARSNAKEWEVEYISDELQDIYGVVKLPKGTSRAKVNIRVFASKR